jgi:hypothetical protein
MWVRRGVTRALLGSLAAIAVGLGAPAASPGAVKFTRVGSIPGTGGAVYAFVRTADETLHIVRPASDDGAQGLAEDSISPSGVIQAPVTALPTDWGVSVPGLLTLLNGSLEAFFGAAEPGTSDTSAWAITSSDGGKTWTTPVDIRSGPLEDLAYSAQFRAEMNGTTPVLALTMGGTVVVQQGLGQNAPTYQVTNAGDGFASDSEAAVDAGSGHVVASWDSVQSTNGGDYIQTVAPSPGTPEKVPGQSRDYEVLAGRDKGAGVFGAYTADGTHVRLLRYGGGTVAVGSLASATPGALGVATGIDGRIWVMWGSDSGNIAVTRSNRAVTRFEPIQHLTAKIDTLFHLAGDGRVGPLDLLADEVADTDPLLPAGVYHARVVPELSAAVKIQTITAVKNKKVATGQTLTVTVTDAGDAVQGATVTVKGHTKKTSSSGVARIALPGSSSGKITIAVTAPTYQKLSTTTKLSRRPAQSKRCMTCRPT